MRNLKSLRMVHSQNQNSILKILFLQKDQTEFISGVESKVCYGISESFNLAKNGKRRGEGEDGGKQLNL